MRGKLLIKAFPRTPFQNPSKGFGGDFLFVCALAVGLCQTPKRFEVGIRFCEREAYVIRRAKQRRIKNTIKDKNPTKVGFFPMNEHK